MKKLGSDLVVQRSRSYSFEAFFEIYKMGMISKANNLNRKNKNKLGSDLVVQRSRYHYFEAVVEIYKMGIVSAA